MAATISIYSCLTEHINRGTIDPDNDLFYIVFLKSTYTENLNGHVQVADLNLAANEYSPTQFGYTAGGMPITSGTVTRVNNVTTVALGNFTLVSNGGTLPAWRKYAVYVNASRNSLTGPLICVGLGDDTAGGTDVPAKPDGASFTLRWNPSGLYRVQV